MLQNTDACMTGQPAGADHAARRRAHTFELEGFRDDQAPGAHGGSGQQEDSRGPGIAQPQVHCACTKYEYSVSGYAIYAALVSALQLARASIYL